MEKDWAGWVQIELTPGLNVTLGPQHRVSKDVFEWTIEHTLTNAYAQLGWDYSKEETHNHAVYFTILYKDLYTQ